MDLVFSENRPAQIIGGYLSFYESIASKTLFDNYKVPKLTKKRLIDFIDIYGHYEFLKSNVNMISIYIYTVKELELLYKNKHYQECIKNITIDIYTDHLIHIDQFSFNNLRVLNLTNYNRSLHNSLDCLTNLEELFMNFFNRPLNDSLSKLEKLRKLSLYSYNYAFENSLSKLTNLEELLIFEYNEPFNDSLNNLTKLRVLESWRYDKPINNSFDKLVNLKILKLDSYNTILNNSLRNLVNLEELKLHSYRERLNSSLNTLKKLHTLNVEFIPSIQNIDVEIIRNITKLSLNLPISKKYIVYYFVNVKELTIRKYTSLDFLRINIKKFNNLEVLNII